MKQMNTFTKTNQNSLRQLAYIKTLLPDQIRLSRLNSVEHKNLLGPQKKFDHCVSHSSNPMHLCDSEYVHTGRYIFKGSLSTNSLFVVLRPSTYARTFRVSCCILEFIESDTANLS